MKKNQCENGKYATDNDVSAAGQHNGAFVQRRNIDRLPLSDDRCSRAGSVGNGGVFFPVHNIPVLGVIRRRLAVFSHDIFRGNFTITGDLSLHRHGLIHPPVLNDAESNQSDANQRYDRQQSQTLLPCQLFFPYFHITIPRSRDSRSRRCLPARQLFSVPAMSLR